MPFMQLVHEVWAIVSAPPVALSAIAAMIAGGVVAALRHRAARRAAAGGRVQAVKDPPAGPRPAAPEGPATSGPDGLPGRAGGRRRVMRAPEPGLYVTATEDSPRQ